MENSLQQPMIPLREYLVTDAESAPRFRLGDYVQVCDDEHQLGDDVVITGASGEVHFGTLVAEQGDYTIIQLGTLIRQFMKLPASDIRVIETV